jgi:hypothetical protein
MNADDHGDARMGIMMLMVRMLELQPKRIKEGRVGARLKREGVNVCMYCVRRYG